MQTQCPNQLPTHFNDHPSEWKFPPVRWSRGLLSCVLKPERFSERFDRQNPPLPPQLHASALELLCSSRHCSRVWVALHSQPSRPFQPHPAAVLRKRSHSDIISGLLQGKWTKWNFISCLINTQFANAFCQTWLCWTCSSHGSCREWAQMPTGHWCLQCSTEQLTAFPEQSTEFRSCCDKWIISGVSSGYRTRHKPTSPQENKCNLGARGRAREAVSSVW